MAHFWRVALVAALFGLAGCAGQPSVPFDRSTAGNIKTIGILTPGFPSGPKVILASTVGQHFGLIGALVDAGMQGNRDATFSSLMASQRYSAQDAFSLALAAALKSEGYAIELIPVTRPAQNRFLDDYRIATNIKVDAYLDTYVGTYGYLASSIMDSSPYRPVFSVGCKLVRVPDGAMLMRDFVIYNPLNPRGGAITLSPNPDYVFVNFDALTADPRKTLAGLDDAVTQTAKAVAKLLQ